MTSKIWGSFWPQSSLSICPVALLSLRGWYCSFSSCIYRENGEKENKISLLLRIYCSLCLSLSQKKTYYEPKSSNYWTFLDYKMVLILEQFFGEKLKTTVCYTNNCINYKIHFDLVKKKILGCTMKLRCPILWLLSSPYRSKAKLFKSPKVISVDITEDVTGEKIKRTSITHLQQTA